MIAYAMIIAYGAVMFALGWGFRAAVRPRELPPATRRAIAFAQKRGRADLRLVSDRPSMATRPASVRGPLQSTPSTGETFDDGPTGDWGGAS